MKKFKSKKGAILWILIIIILLLDIYIFFDLRYQKQRYLDSNKENLQVLANEKAMQVNSFLEAQKEKLFVLNTINVFKEAVMNPGDIVKIEEANKTINELKSIIPGISILTNEGIAVVGEFDLLGTDYSQHPYFVRKDKNISFERYYDPLRKEDYYAIIGPIYDNTNKSKIIGRLAFDIELSKISALMKETLEDNKTNEIYLIDETGLLLSYSKYIGQENKKGVLIQEVKSNGAKVCLDDLKKYEKNGIVEKHEEEVIQYTNYMGDNVFGAHAYVPEIMGCIIAEQNANKITNFLITDPFKNIFKKEVKDEK
jgi:nitrogen regulatory protein PII-like uncharacterized protein